jgi:hypothetical protein
LACFCSLLVLSSSLCLAAEKRVTRSVVVLISLFLSRLNDWKLILRGGIGSSNKIVDILEFLVLLGASDTMFVTGKELGISDTTTPG